MDAVRTGFAVVAVAMVVVGAIAAVWLELSAPGRRLVTRWRDAVEVVLPGLLMVALTWLVWLDRV